METPGKCSEWTRRRCKHCPPLYGAANVCAEYYTSKLRDNYECDDEEDT